MQTSSGKATLVRVVPTEGSPIAFDELTEPFGGIRVATADQISTELRRAIARADG